MLTDACCKLARKPYCICLCLNKVEELMFYQFLKVVSFEYMIAIHSYYNIGYVAISF